MWTLLRMAAAAGLATIPAWTAAGAAPVPLPQSLPAQRAVLAALRPNSPAGPCLRPGQAFLRARIRGAVRLDVDLHGRGLTCEGGPRLDGGGIRMGFEGRAAAVGSVRMIFGIDGAKEGRPGRELPTNLTVIFGRGKRLFATQGDANCTVDRLTQAPIGAAGAAAAKTRAYRVVAHGFCIGPVNDISGRRRIVVTTFDFAGRADFHTP